jgi:NADPH:quinone reductase-like Zn-dependent oxidoreductase
VDRQGDIVLIWGASGGLGSYATQFTLNGSGIPVCVVSSSEKAEIRRRIGAEPVIDRAAEGVGVDQWTVTRRPRANLVDHWTRALTRASNQSGCLSSDPSMRPIPSG